MALQQGIHFLTSTVSVHVYESSKPGNTVLIQAGIHGDEVAGVHALQEMLEDGISIDCGKLIVIPVMNVGAYRARQRKAPGGLDMNRCFPGDSDALEKEKRLARKFMDLILDEKPALVATLHESLKKYDPEVNPSFGQSLVYGVNPMPEVIGNVLSRLNQNVQSNEEHWAEQCYPVATSSTEVIVDAIGCVGVCVETWMGFEERRRIEMQKEVVRYFLEEFEILNQ